MNSPASPPRIEEESGWIGSFTRDQAPGAIANGNAIEKARSEDGDGTPDGTPGVVLGSFSHPDVQNGAKIYFVEWSNRPRCAVAVMEWKIRPAG